MNVYSSFRVSTAAGTLGAAVVALCLAAAANAVPLKTDTAKSSVGAVFKQLNVPVEAKFKKVAAQIDYDSAKPEASKARVDIDIASFDLGDPDYNKEILKKA